MDRIKRIYPLCIIGLIVLYAVLAFCMLHPSVSLAYCEYFLSGAASHCSATTHLPAI